MPNDSSFPYTPENDPQPRSEVHPQTGSYGYHEPWQNGRQPGVNSVSPYHGRNDTNYGDWAQYPYHGWNERLPPPSQSAGQYTYQGNPGVDYAPPGNPQQVQYAAVPGPGPPSMEYHIPPAHGVPNGVPVPSATIPDIAEPFSQNVPNSDSRASAMEDLKRMAIRYLHNPDSRIDTLRMGLSPSSGRFMVVILLEVDDLI